MKQSKQKLWNGWTTSYFFLDSTASIERRVSKYLWNLQKLLRGVILVYLYRYFCEMMIH